MSPEPLLTKSEPPDRRPDGTKLTPAHTVLRPWAEVAAHELIEDMRRHIKSTEALFGVLPEKLRTGHLADEAKRLIARADRLVGANTEQGSASE